MLGTNNIIIVTEKPENCKFIAYLDQAFTDVKKEGVSKLRKRTVAAGGNMLYMPPDKQEVLAGRLKRVFLSVGSAYLCPEPLAQ